MRTVAGLETIMDKQDVYHHIPYPASLHYFEKIKDCTHREEVGFLMNFVEESKRRILDASHKFDFYSQISSRGNKNQLNSVHDILNFFPENIAKNEFIHDFVREDELSESFYTSIVGGYCRNILLGTENMKTDIDIATQGGWNYEMIDHFLSFLLPQIKNENKRIRGFHYPGNEIHLLPSGMEITKGPEKTKHSFVNPIAFDFTINLGSISSTDGCLYAPPITMNDICTKTIRPVLSMFEDYNILKIMDFSMGLRAIRFALKYDMSIYNDMYKAIKVYFSMSNILKDTDDIETYHALRHLLDEPEDLQHEIFSLFQKLHLYETESFSQFKDYYSHVENKFHKSPRLRKMLVDERRSGYDNDFDAENFNII